MGESTSTAALTPEKANVVAKRHRQQRQGGESFPTRDTRFVDTARPYVDLALGGRTIRVARLTWREIEPIEESEEFGGLPGYIASFTRRPARMCRDLLYRATRRTHEELTEEDCGDLLPTAVPRLIELADTLLFATGLLERPDEDDEGNAARAEAAAPRTGSF